MKNKVYFIIGVAGCGKSTIGAQLAESLRIPFYDGDDFHPESNIRKMASGKPLTYHDRSGWLDSLNKLALTELENNSLVISCSALKENYRKMLEKISRGIAFGFFSAEVLKPFQPELKIEKNTLCLKFCCNLNLKHLKNLITE